MVLFSGRNGKEMGKERGMNAGSRDARGERE
jgi:hypothetical protein